MASKQDWLTQGISVIAQEGPNALTIERLTGRLGVTKGSFYHHFAGMAGYQAALLDHYERTYTTRVTEELGSLPNDPSVKVTRLLDMIASIDEPDLDMGMRAWAAQDPKVAQMHGRVDQARIAFLESIWLDAGRSPDDARHLGQLLYLVLVGSSHVFAGLPPEDLRAVCRLILERL